MNKPLKFLFTLLLVFVNSFSQSGKVTYSIMIDSSLYKNNITENTNLLLKIKKLASEQKFELFFNKNQSSFNIIEEMSNDNIDANENLIAKFALTSGTQTYVDKNLKIEINKNSFDNVLFESQYNDYGWEILSETKQIDSYTCFKAIKKIPFINRFNEKKTNVIVAWFAPSIPYPFGPKSYYELPGLILELHENNTTFFASKIELSEAEIEIDFPKGKIVPKEEYDKKLKAQMGM